jgi:uncharacterized protein YdeI (YjbR/CyaY-like superfamily)
LSEDNPRYFRSIEEWQNWLNNNHKIKKSIWVVIQKKASQKIGIRYEDAVLEAVAHGWIDGILKRIDDDEFKQRYTPRRKNSIWSLRNRERANKLISEGRMTKMGMGKVEEAKRNGRWDNAYSSSRKNFVIPNDLKEALMKNVKAIANFKAFPPHAQFMYVHWINEAKRKDTRKRRINTVVIRSEKKLRPGIDLRIIE